MQWDVFCRVVDNFGDVGVCWRLAADLAARGETVRLFIDDVGALAWMAPGGAAGVSVLPWPLDRAVASAAPVGDVVVEAFGCDPPPAFVTLMAAKPRPPLWINLEYLSAEAYVERCHGLPSPQASGLVKRFFYPGFTAASGGLLREPGLLQQQAAFDATAWLQSLGITRQAGERVVSLFCYAAADLPSLLALLERQPTLLLACAGAATEKARACLGNGLQRGGLRAIALPLLSQVDYDHLLWACDLNFVRGEDSFVRAQWAGRPFVWQAYPQSDGAHGAKLDAFLARFLADAEPGFADGLAGLWRDWNCLGSRTLELPPQQLWQTHALRWRDNLLAQDDLCSQLLHLARPGN
jgi:uncharacterized repeat protein (TIGR03837 family)